MSLHVRILLSIVVAWIFHLVPRLPRYTFKKNIYRVTLVVKSVSQIIYNENVPDVSVAILYKITDKNKTLIKIQDMCHFFLLARVKCKYSLGSNAP